MFGVSFPTEFWRFFFAPPHETFIHGNIWGNIFASIIWGFFAGFIGYLVAKKVKAAWARLHRRLDVHEQHHEAHARKLDEISRALVELKPKPKAARKPPARKAG